MMITLRPQAVEDAEKLYEILTHAEFPPFPKPLTLDDERMVIRQNTLKRKRGLEYTYVIVEDGKVVGGCGIKIDQYHRFIGELGYFVAREEWGRGVATEAVRQLEKAGFEKLGLKRIEIRTPLNNSRSEKVATKTGYTKEGVMRKAIKINGTFYDALLYAKTEEDYFESQATSSLSKS